MATLAKPESLKGAICPKSELLELTGYTPQRLDQLVAEGTIVRVGRGMYDVWPTLVGLMLHIKSKKLNQWDGDKSEGEAEGGGYEYHRARLTAAKADVAEIDAMLRKGQAHDGGAVAQVWGDMLMNARAKLLSLPKSMAGQVHGEESLERVEALLSDAIHNALNELSEYDPALVTDAYVQSHSESMEAASEMEDFRMERQPEKAVKRSKRRARPVADKPG